MQCDHTSVGMLVYKSEDLLLIERRLYPSGFSPPSGHVDGDASYEFAASRELQEETGLHAINLELIKEGRKGNPCRREGGTWHYWKIYRAEVEGEIVRSLSETKSAKWYNPEEIKKLYYRTSLYLEGKVSEGEWQRSPGIEPVWHEWLNELHMLL